MFARTGADDGSVTRMAACPSFKVICVKGVVSLTVPL